MTQVAIAGAIYSFREIGHGTRTPLVILHGWGRSGAEWIPLAESLSSFSKRKVYVLDLPGFGGSSLPNVASIQAYAELVMQWCSYLAIDKAIVMGHSLGGRVGILLASQHPSLVEQLILIDPAGVKPRSLKRSVLKLLALLFSWVPVRLRRVFTHNLMDEDYRNSPALRDLYRAVVGADLRSYLSLIQCQVGVIWGEHDPILPLSLTKFYRRSLQHPTVRVVWGAGHDPHLSHPDQLRTIVEEMLT